MAKRYELTERQWSVLRDLVPGKKGDRGRAGADNKAFVDGVLWGLRSGARWSDLPPRYGAKWKSVHRRFCRWAHAGVWERLFRVLLKAPDNEYRMIDSAIIRAHQQAATGKGERPTRLWGVPEEG